MRFQDAWFVTSQGMYFVRRLLWLARGVWMNSWSKAPPDWRHSLSPVRCSSGTLASSALGRKRQRRVSIASIEIL